MKINKKLLPIKLHYFFFMAALGPILPQLPLIGKDLGISSLVMGIITGILPFTFLLTKPFFGLLFDVYRQYRKIIFLSLIITMTLSFGAIYFLPSKPLLKFNLKFFNYTSSGICDNTTPMVCNSTCLTKTTSFLDTFEIKRLCALPSSHLQSEDLNCDLTCTEQPAPNLYKTLTFWAFIIFISVATIGFNVVNSISDAVCFDVVENQELYGKQRLWGSVGFGLTGLISGYMVDLVSAKSLKYIPAFVTMTTCSIFDLFVCLKLELPVIPAPKHICKDLKLVLNDKHVLTFITFAVLAGMLDALIIYFFFWYLEDLAMQTNTPDVKLIEGLILAAETLGAEVIFFSLSGKILQRLGHVHTFTTCFFNYALRFGLIAIAPSPWWFLPIELFMQGPTYALTYTAIVAYADDLAPAGMSATMQGIAAGMSDGTGYAIGSVIGGLLYRYVGGKATFQIFTGMALGCGVLHFVLHKTILKRGSIRSGYETIK
ncbi:hypothetical protein MTP99_015061 [Tenebrio molitor]|nr:hypothetical protein MTP99_015061 [Tenebrio molitor]